MASYIHTDIESESKKEIFQSFRKVYRISRKSNVQKWLLGIIAFLILILFLPWTQNIRAKGMVTALRQEQRPQEVNTIIAGRILKWYVKEGDLVKEGDTLLQLGEVKVDYFDPQLVQRTKEQLTAKAQSKQSYLDKTVTGDTQILALTEAQKLKLSLVENKIQQQYLKIISDSMDLIAVNNELLIYKRQIDAAKIMLDSGAISLSEFEKRKVNFQNGLAKRTGTENKYRQSRQELTSLQIEKSSAVQDYRDKIAKAEGEKLGSMSAAASTEADVAKLQNTLANYDARNQLYYIRAPQSGQVVRARKAGIGEMLKEGEMAVEIVPDNMQYAVEMFVDPVDLPLVNKGQKVRFVFDGFPAIIFSGWPQNSYGTFAGKVVAIESAAGTNGKFRILVTEDPNERKWPSQLRLGSGANGIALLKDVPVYYELWRNINGFPPDYYTGKTETKNKEGK